MPMKAGMVLSGLLTFHYAGAFLFTVPPSTSAGPGPDRNLKNECPTSPSFQFQHHATEIGNGELAVTTECVKRRRPVGQALSAVGSAGDSSRESGEDGEESMSASANTSNSSGMKQNGGLGDDGEEVPHEESETLESKKKEEEEGELEQLFVPTMDTSDRRLYRAKLFAGSDDKWREQLKRNVNERQLAGQDAWAHELSAPEKGCLIVAKTSMFSLAQHYFNEAVIFLASHDENGSAGFILNRPTQVSLGDLVEGNTLPHFGASPLYLGGDVGEGNVQIVHPFGPDMLSGAMEIIPGVYIGGAVDEADRLVSAGQAKAEDFRFFLHLCGWAPGQLEAEIKRGVWFAAACSANVITKHCIQLPVPMWREVMTLMGPKYSLLARDTYDDL